MRDRCHRKKNRIFKYYGGRGITVCQQWLDFATFYSDMGPCPAGYTIERKDYNGNYEPGNCCWIPKSEQSQNRRNCLPVYVDGLKMSIPTAAKAIGMAHWTLRRRIASGAAVPRLQVHLPQKSNLGLSHGLSG